MKKFVMFGQSRFFGEYLDLIHALDGVLSRVIINVPDPVIPGTKTFANRIEDYHSWLSANGSSHHLRVLDLEDFVPDPEEIAILGFRGLSSRPLRQRLKEEFNIDFPPLVHPDASVSPFAKIREGCVICSSAAIASWAEIGPFTLVNRNASVGHDTCVGTDTDISPNAAIAGNVVIEEAVRIGVGASVIENLHLQEGCYVAAGAAVINSVPPWVIVAGVPAIVKKERPGRPAAD